MTVESIRLFQMGTLTALEWAYDIDQCEFKYSDNSQCRSRGDRVVEGTCDQGHTTSLKMCQNHSDYTRVLATFRELLDAAPCPGVIVSVREVPL